MAGLPAGVTAGPLAIAPPALSFHLKALTHAGLLVQQHAANFFALAEAKARADRWPVQYSILNASILGRVGSAQADERMKTSATGYIVPKPKTPCRAADRHNARPPRADKRSMPSQADAPL